MGISIIVITENYFSSLILCTLVRVHDIKHLPVLIGWANGSPLSPIYSCAAGVATAPRVGIRGLGTFVEILANETG